MTRRERRHQLLGEALDALDRATDKFCRLAILATNDTRDDLEMIISQIGGQADELRGEIAEKV